ncbi:hypothetical protein EMVG_00126 [Emiliania huxleyi virus PS401]|jgi:thiol-disulfide isomerase/thioredoxin|nr:hypothetical protein EMVG_00126 [Emiliania huxleyi virus PS401]
MIGSNGSSARRPGFKNDERYQIAQRAEGRKDRNNGYATKKVIDGSDPQALVTEKPIVVLFYWLQCPYCIKYRPMWNAVADSHNAQGKRCPVPMISLSREAMTAIVRGGDEASNPGLIGGYIKEFPTVRVLQNGETIAELEHPCRGDDGVNPTDRLRRFVQEACDLVEVDPGFVPI